MGWKFNALSASVTILLVAYFNWEVEVKILFSLMFFSVFLAWNTRKARSLHPCKAALTLLFIIAGLCYGVWANQLYRESGIPDSLLGQTVWIKGQVDDIPTVSLGGKKFPLQVSCLGTEAKACKPTSLGKLMVTWPDAPALGAGDEVVLAVKLSPIQSNPNARFNALRWAKQSRISGQARVVQHQASHVFEWHWTVNRIRSNLMNQVMIFLDPDNSTNRLFPALIVGARSDLTDEQWRVMNLSGTTHLFAISGMHVTFFASVIYAIGFYFLRRISFITARWSAQNCMAIMAYGVALAYGFLAGMSVPTLRTLVMLGIILLAKLMHRYLSGMTLFMTTLLGVLLVDPFSGLSVGFWLSFLAVGILIWVDQHASSSSAQWLAGLKTQWWISIGMIPITLYYFQVIPLMAFFANLIAIPVVGSLVVPLALIATLMIFINHWAAQQLFNLAAWVLDLCWRYLQWTTELPFASFEQVMVPAASLLLVVIGAALILMPRSMRFAPLAILCLSLPLFVQHEAMDKGVVKVNVFGGDDQTILLRSNSKTLLVKNGEFNNQLKQFLSAQNVARIDYWLAPKYASLDLNNRFTKESVIIKPVPTASNQGACTDEQNWEGIEISFFLIPGNESQCALKVKTAKDALLILPNSVKSGFKQLDIAAFNTIIAHANLLKSALSDHSNLKRILIASRQPKKLAEKALTGVSLEWIYGKETELVLN